MFKKKYKRWSDSSNYAFRYLLFNASSDEHLLQKKHLFDRAKLFLSTKSTVLDIGAADGDLTHLLFSGVKKLVAYESNMYLCQLFAHKFGSCSNAVIYDSPWTLHSYSVDLYDVISMHHILYHIKNDVIVLFLNNLMRYLSYNGVVIISLWSNKSELYEIANDIGGIGEWSLTAESFSDLISASFLRDYVIDEYTISPLVKPFKYDVAKIILPFFVGEINSSLHNDYYNMYVSRLIAGLYNHQKVFLIRKIFNDRN